MEGFGGGSISSGVFDEGTSAVRQTVPEAVPIAELAKMIEAAAIRESRCLTYSVERADKIFAAFRVADHLRSIAFHDMSVVD